MKNRLHILHGGTIASMVDLGGSLAVASMGLFGTGVSTDLNGMASVNPGYPKAELMNYGCNSHLSRERWKDRRDHHS